MKNTVLFDFDGTVADTSQLIIDSWQHTYRTLTGREHDEKEIISTFGEPLHYSFKNAFPGMDVEKCLNIYRSYQMMQKEERWVIFPGIPELMRDLKSRDYAVGIVTSRTRVSCTKGLTAGGIIDYVDAIVCCDDTKVHKPNPEPAFMALEKLDAKAEDALMIGDTRFDIGCARNAGIDAVLVSWSISIKPEMVSGAEAADYIIDKPKELLRVLRQC